MTLLEAVPNLSEGRRPEVVERLVAAVATPAVALLDRSSDPDHGRTVLTLAGPPRELQEALLRLYETALGEIDLGRQQGVHPRVGAVDVVPFVPLAGAPMEEAVEAARSLGREVARRFALPVFLYEEAASQPHRRNLAEVRRGGVEGLARRMESPAWRPDFGPPRLHPTAGATALGARFFLIALNAVLATGEVAVARRIARRVRESSGGLAAVKALGLHLESRGRAQVSMNLVDYRRTSIAATLDRVRQEAWAEGTRVLETEVVGLVPAAALPADPRERESLGLLTSPEELTLEHHLERCGAPLPGWSGGAGASR